MADPKIEEVLKSHFHLETFRLGQREIISSVLARKDVLAVMPTGGGKSLCYQLPAYMQPGLTLVISPLIALMNDQVQSLRALNLPAGCIHSGLNEDEKRQVFSDMQSSRSFVLYISPERTQMPNFANWLRSQKLNLIAVDEAHCVSQWGHDFRPEYAQLANLRELSPQTPVLALTATATPIVKNDIIEHLALVRPDQHVYGFYRPNLYYQVEFCAQESMKESYVLQALRQTPHGRILIYCGTRKKAQEWAKLLKAQRESVGYYHAGLSPEKRVQIERNYALGKIRILAATNAFGMGIDHPDVRLVLHTQMPGNIESYYQEVGRAGRDGQESTCLLMYSPKDKGLQSYFIRESDASQRIKNHRWQALDAIVSYSEGSECRHADILTYFKDSKRITQCGHCDSCVPNSTRRISTVVENEETIVLENDNEPRAKFAKVGKKRKNKKTRAEDVELSQKELLQWELIREWRKAYAKTLDLPAFMIFGDKTLQDLVLKAPTNEKELAEVYGLGDKKIAQFGQQLLAQINTWGAT